MNFDSLKIFKTVVDEGGIIAAARKLHRVQSGVTTWIKQLEASLGVELFLRDKRRLTLSPTGEIFLGYVEQLLRLAEQARHAVLGDTPRGVAPRGTAARHVGEHGSESLAATPGALSPAVSGRACGIGHGHDGCLGGRRGVPQVRRGLRYRACGGHRLGSFGAFDEELVIVAPRSHPAIGCAHDVRTDTIICFPIGCAYRRLLHAWLAAGTVVPDKVLELSSYHAIVACVASGTGIALVPRSVLETVRVSDSIAVYLLPTEHARMTTYLVWRHGEISPALRALQAEILASNPRRA
jgi:DNA-binding transcriptional LysR family regulator